MSPSPSTAERRLLRIGIIHGRRIVEERVVAELGDITIGTSPRSTFIVPWDEVPHRWRLFEARGGRRFLRLAGNMTARIAEGASATSVDARGGQGARPIPLADRARGKVTLGDTTVLFQLLRPPPPQPRPQLPHSIRPRVLAEIDRGFAAVLALTALLHVAVVVYLRQVDWPRRPLLEEIPDRFLRQMARAPRPTPPPVAPALVAAEGPKAPLRPHPPVSAAPRTARAPVETHADIEAKVRRMGLIPLLTAPAADGHAPLADLLANGAVDRSLDEALRDVGGVTIASSDGLRGLPRPGSGSGRVGVTDLRGGARIVDAGPNGPVVERDVSSRLKVAPPVVEGGHADLASITREIRARRKAIAACYERALKQTPTLAGKLVVRFSIAAAGTVSTVDIDDDTLGAPAVGACVRALVLSWRFAPPADAPVELSFPFLFQVGG